MTRPLVDGVLRSKHPLRGIWDGIRSRCLNPRSSSYGDYGGRGITVCDRWRDSFDAFVEDMAKIGQRPSPGHSVDRINNDGDYEPGNVRWATPKEQSVNRRTSANWDRHAPLRAPIRIVSSAAQLALWRWVSSQRASLRVVGARIGCTHAAILQWVSGKQRPEHHFRLAIERIAGVPAEDWMTDAEYAIAYGHERTRRPHAIAVGDEGALS